MDLSDNLAAVFLRQAAAEPGRLAIWSPEGAVSAGQLHDTVMLMALHLQTAGVRRGQGVEVRSGDPTVLLGSLLATALLGAWWGCDGAPGADWRLLSEGGAGVGDLVMDESWARLPEGVLPGQTPKFAGFSGGDDVWVCLPGLAAAGLSLRAVALRVAEWRGAGGVVVGPLSGAAIVTEWLAALMHQVPILWGNDPAEPEVFVVGGVALNAALLDFALRQVPGVRDAVCFMMPRAGRVDRLTAFVSLAAGAAGPDVLAGARLALLRVGGVAAVPERFLFADDLPRRVDGSPDRQACVARVLRAKALKRLARTVAEPPQGG